MCAKQHHASRAYVTASIKQFPGARDSSTAKPGTAMVNPRSGGNTRSRPRKDLKQLDGVGDGLLFDPAHHDSLDSGSSAGTKRHLDPWPEGGSRKHFYFCCTNCNSVTFSWIPAPTGHTSAVINVGHADLVPVSNFGRREDPWFI